MIATLDIQTIIMSDCKRCADFGISEIYPKDDEPSGEISAERIVVSSKSQQPERIWKKNFVEVNLCVPDIDGSADTIRMGELERVCIGHFNDICGRYDGTPYEYSIYSIGTEERKDLRYHYINMRLIFNVLNSKLL